MVKGWGTGFILLMLSAYAVALSGQADSGKGLRIRLRTLPQRLHVVAIIFQLTTSEDPMFVPYCEKQEGGEEVLCSLATHLEFQTTHGWQKAVFTEANLLSKDLRKADGRVVPPRSKKSFFFLFSTEIYRIKPGTRLRVIMDAWPDEASMRAGAPPTQVTSPEFVCPPE